MPNGRKGIVTTIRLDEDDRRVLKAVARLESRHQGRRIRPTTLLRELGMKAAKRRLRHFNALRRAS